jgi:hypothetical protein
MKQDEKEDWKDRILIEASIESSAEMEPVEVGRALLDTA